MIKKLLFRKKIEKRYDRGNLYSLFKIIKYFVWIVAILIILEELGLKLNALLAGSAALLVGIGLGLQNTFNNFISGIILLFEGSIHVGDELEIDNDVVQIEKISLRTSKAINRDYISIIIPNSIITSNKVVNWSNQDRKTRFRIENVKSDIRKIINEKFIEHKISIPFPQVDLHFVSDKTGYFNRKGGTKVYEGINE